VIMESKNYSHHAWLEMAHGGTVVLLHQPEPRMDRPAGTVVMARFDLMPLISSLCKAAEEQGELSETIHWTGDSRSGWWVPGEVDDE